MQPLPEDVALALLRGVAAYIRASPTQELPAGVRRFQNFRASALGRHRDRILALLDDDASRLRILEWLDDGKTALSKEDAAALRIAAAREDGWPEELATRSRSTGDDAGPGAPGDTHESDKALQREKEKLRKAKEEVRRVRAEAASELKEQRAKMSALEAENERLIAALDRSEAEARTQTRRAETTEEKAARELRRARKEAQEAEKVSAEVRAELRGLRKENTALQRKLEEHAQPKKKRTPKQPAKKKPAGPRKPLPTPKGRFEDAPETLDEWLGREGVHLVVDGYNVTKAEGGFGDLELETQRDRLVQEVSKLARKKDAKSTVVFDGTKVPPGTSKLARGPARVEFSVEETADDHIVALLDELPRDPVIVATNDRELQARVAAKGATVATSNQLLALLR